MDLTLSPIVYVVTWSPKIDFIEVVFVLEAETIASHSSVTEVRFAHKLNALPPIFVTLFPIVIEVRLAQFLKASKSILVTFSGIVIEVSLLQPVKA